MDKKEEFFQSLFPYTNLRMEQARDSNQRFVHYTSAHAALSIIQKESVWMRSANAMNDFSEIEHGRRCLQAAWNHDVYGNKLKYLLNSVESGSDKRFEQIYSNGMHDLFFKTFLISVSEHGNSDINEDIYGRLSMWRAYGGDTNVALVFKNDPFLRESSATNAYTSPVLYCDEESFCGEFSKVVANLEIHIETAKEFGADYTLNVLKHVFHFATVSAKHRGFAEEREWRVIYSPTFYHSDRITFDIETIAGVPQRVYKFPLKNFPEEDHFGVTIPELLDEILIGPTSQGYLIYDALVLALENAGVEKADEKVKLSNIPLRR